MVQLLSLLTVVIVSGVLGLLSYYNNPRSATNKMTTFFSFTMIFWASTMYLSLHPPAFDQTLFYIRLSMLAAIAMSTAVLLLSHTIPSNEFFLSKFKTTAILVLACLGMLTAMSPYMFTGIEIKGENIEPVSGPGMLMFLVTGLGYSISGIFVLLKKYLRSKGVEKQQLLFVLIGITIMHILLITANFIIVLIFKSSYFISFGPFFTLTFLISAFYAITRHRFLEIRLVVTRTITFTFLIFTIASIYAGLLFAVTDYIPESMRQMVEILIAVLVSFTFSPLKKTIEKITAKVFFRKNYDSNQVLDELGEIISSTLYLKTLTTKVLTHLSNILQIERAGFLLLDEVSIKTAQIGYDELPELSRQNINLIIQKARQNPFLYEQVTQNTIKPLFQMLKAAVIIPLENSGKMHGIMVLGQKKSGDVYSNQDLALLNIFTPQISVAIQNSLAYEKIRKFNVTLKKEVEEATDKLKTANKNLRHLDRLKDEFVYVATHELKNPVTAMKGYLSMIDEGSFGKIPKNLQDPLYQITQSNQQLVNLVNDLLQIARAEANTLTVKVEAINLCDIVQGVVESIIPLAERKHITVDYPSSKDPIMVMGDRERLKEVFNNLISNAIKYSEKGAISISYAKENNFVITHVKDEGFGIPKKDQPRIFSRFFRVAEEAAKGIPGSGLGLFIVRQLVEKMGGKIWFTSVLGKGSTFSFSIPKAE